eukprot:g8046.t1
MKNYQRNNPVPPFDDTKNNFRGTTTQEECFAQGNDESRSNTINTQLPLQNAVFSGEFHSIDPKDISGSGQLVHMGDRGELVVPPRHPRSAGKALGVEESTPVEGTLCQWYMRTAQCDYGANCKFVHPPGVKPPPLNSLRCPFRPGVEKCKYYMKHGICKYRETCKFNHPERRQEATNANSPSQESDDNETVSYSSYAFPTQMTPTGWYCPVTMPPPMTCPYYFSQAPVTTSIEFHPVPCMFAYPQLASCWYWPNSNANMIPSLPTDQGTGSYNGVFYDREDVSKELLTDGEDSGSSSNVSVK